MFSARNHTGFTLIEIIVVVSIISLLAAGSYVGYNEVKAQARDKARAAALQQLQLALENYKAEYGRYPERCSGGPPTAWAGPGPMSGSDHSCDDYIVGNVGTTPPRPFIPNFISTLPRDPRDELKADLGFKYRVNNDGTSYKVLVEGAVESEKPLSYNDRFARCPRACGSCGATFTASTTYAIYSAGEAECW